MTYSSAADALLGLFGGKEKESAGARCWISWKPSGIKYDVSGIEIYSIEVTCSNGIQYMIPACGYEAIILEDVARTFGVPMQIPFIEA